jgi:hypothetical protein
MSTTSRTESDGRWTTEPRTVPFDYSQVKVIDHLDLACRVCRTEGYVTGAELAAGYNEVNRPGRRGPLYKRFHPTSTTGND